MKRLSCLLLAALLLLLPGCCRLDGVKDALLERGTELLLGDEALQQLLFALGNANLEALREAVEAGADVNTIKPALITDNPLFYIISVSERMGWDLFGNCTNDDLSEYLLGQGADPDWANSSGQTLLMLCCGCDGLGYVGAERLLEQLLAHGADVGLTDRKGYTALDYAAERSAEDDIGQLLAHGAVPTARTVELAFFTLREDPWFNARALAARRVLEAYEDAGGAPVLPTGTPRPSWPGRRPAPRRTGTC